jgi:hypothetical protein
MKLWNQDPSDVYNLPKKKKKKKRKKEEKCKDLQVLPFLHKKGVNA